MDRRLTETALVGLGVAYLAGLAHAMSTTSYDVWGLFVAVPPMSLVTVWGVRRVFRHQFAPLVAPMLVGFVAKIAGSLARYWVAFDAYGGSTDSQRYHLYGSAVADSLWQGTIGPRSIIPGGTGTEFVERFTGLVYSLIGSSKLTGFVFFGWLAFWGVVLFVKAACLAVPGLAARRYAWLMALAPSLVYWPSSIGKEALMMCFLGIGTYGIARILTRRGFLAPLAWTIVGLGGAALVRPHIAGVWLAGVLPALLVALGKAIGRSDAGRRGIDLFFLSIIVIVALIALAVVGRFALRYLQPGDESLSASEGITAILNETTRRSDQGGSNFEPVEVRGPRDWPFAVVRTLTRPLPNEAQGLFQLLSAAEMAALIGLCLVSWRRMLNLPRAVLTIPYVAFAMTALFAAGLAYASFANLGILTRQKSLVFPLLLLIPCLPLRTARPAESTEPIRAGRAVELV